MGVYSSKRKSTLFLSTLLILKSITCTCKDTNQLNSWLLHVFNECTIQILGSHTDFNEKVTTFGNQNPTVIDVYEFPNNLGRYNRTVLLQRRNVETIHTVLSRFSPKYTPCIVTNFFLSGHLHPHLIMNSINYLVESFVLSNENPNFIIFMFNHPPNFNTKMLASAMNGVSVTSIPFIATDTPHSIEILCLTCAGSLGSQVGNLLGLQIKSKTLLTKQVQELNRNLLGRFVVFDGTILYPPYYTCGLRRHHLNTDSSACTISILARKNNFSYTNNQRVHPFWKIGQMYTGFGMSRAAIQQNYFDAIKHHRVKLVWLPHGCIYKRYKYVAFMSKQDAVNFLSLFQPFDIQTAGLLLASTTGVVGVLFLLIFFKSPFLFQNYCRLQSMATIVFYPVKSLIEKDDATIITASRNTLGGYFLISAWLFLCYVIGNEYKGAMYSGMTSSPIQPVPESMIDLVMFSDVPYYTTTKHMYEGRYYSTMKDMVLADMIYTGEENFMTQFLFKFRHHLCLLYGSESDIIFNITQKRAIDTEHGWKMIINKFALVSTEQDTDVFVGLMKKLTDYYIIPNNKVSPFVSRFPWFGKRNVFIKIMSSGISQLVQSGIYDRWNDHFQKSELIKKLKAVDQRLNISATSYYAMVVLAESQRQNLDGSQITWTKIDLVFLGCGILIAGSFVILILEMMLVKLCSVQRTTPVVQFLEFEFTS